MSQAFALYRFPHADHYFRLEGETQEYISCAQLNDVSGFVVAPFEVTAEQPIVVISPDRLETAALPIYNNVRENSVSEQTTPAADYAIDFANFHSQLQQGIFRKIVLARTADETATTTAEPVELFHRACHLYPRLFIALVYTPQSGMWLTATPEVLIEGGGGTWHTVALAGTMKLEKDQLSGEGETAMWSTKNIEEQRIVATYVAECLEQFATDFSEEGPRTVRAANLVHLRSDFTFTLPDDRRVGDLLGQLHPTPAVCGLPKREAFQFIVRNEHTPRRYYSGFMGPMNVQQSTHLYVSLRCMSIDGGRYRLYAGGGLLKDSTELQEWQETEAKLETMRRCIATNKA